MFSTFMLALSLTSTANTLVVMSIGPLLTAIATWIVLKEPVPGRTWAAALACGVGIAWMAASGMDARGGRDLAGMLVALTVPVAAATNFVVLRYVARRDAHQRVDLVPAVMLGGLLSCVAVLPFALPLQATPRDIALLGFLGIFQLALPCMLMVVASRVLPAPEVALIGMLEVILGTLWAWLFAGETPGAATLAGGAIVLGALAVNELAGFRRIMTTQASVTLISG
jgi:drug/metabolite transporter (DMT)-like permease